MPFGVDYTFKGGFSNSSVMEYGSSLKNSIQSSASSIGSNITNAIQSNGNLVYSEAKGYFNDTFSNLISDFKSGLSKLNTSEVEYPAAPGNGCIMGLPFHMVSASADPMLHNIFIQSFPIMKVKAFRIKRSDNSTDYVKERYENIPGGGYEFAIMNEGGTGINVNNDFGPCILENQFNEITNNSAFAMLGEMTQMSQSNSLLGPTVAGSFNKATDMAKQGMDTVLESARNAISGLSNNGLGGAAKDIGNGAIDVVGMFGDALLQGARIDIPNIWKSSSGGATANVKIRLRCRYAGSHNNPKEADDDFKNQILDPLRILLLLSCPARLSDGNTNGGGVTYQNPPYLEISIDKMFESKCCAIKNMSVTFDYMRESFCNGRPMAADVSLTIEDMYQVLVWDKESYNSDTKPPESDMIPSSRRIIGNLSDNTTNSQIEGLENSLLQGHIEKKYGEFDSNSSIFDTFDRKLGSSKSGTIRNLTNENSITNISEPGIDYSWYKSKYELNYEEWEKILNSSNEYNNNFENAWYKFNSGGGFDFSTYTTAVNSVSETLTDIRNTVNSVQSIIYSAENLTQRYGNFDLTSKMRIDNFNDIINIPNQILYYFNGVRSEIRDFVAKIDYASDTFTDAVSLVRDNVQVESDDDVEKLDKIFDVTYYRYQNK